MIEKTLLQDQVARAARLVRETCPVTPSITNTVTINFVANAQLALGGSAAMVYLPEEGERMAEVGAAMYINVGTLLPIYDETLPRTARRLAELHRPWALDPVAVGVGEKRTSLLRQLKPYKPSIVRANASEVIALAKVWGLTDPAPAKAGSASNAGRVVDSADDVTAARGAAVAIARYTGGAVAVSGEVDLVTDGDAVIWSQGGSPLMTKVTGSGCSLGGACATYLACAETPLIAALAAVNVYNLAGRRAAERADAPASFQIAFIDELYRATPEDIAANPIRIEEA